MLPELGDIRWLDVNMPRDGGFLLGVVLLRNLRITEYKLVSLRHVKARWRTGDLCKIILVELVRVRLPRENPGVRDSFLIMDHVLPSSLIDANEDPFVPPSSVARR